MSIDTNKYFFSFLKDCKEKYNFKIKKIVYKSIYSSKSDKKNYEYTQYYGESKNTLIFLFNKKDLFKDNIQIFIDNKKAFNKINQSPIKLPAPASIDEFNLLCCWLLIVDLYPDFWYKVSDTFDYDNFVNDYSPLKFAEIENKIKNYKV